jgi:hypothetical protein
MQQSVSFVPHWLPSILCGVLGVIVLLGLAVRASREGKSMEWWLPAFFGVLPMCFVAMGFLTYRMDRQMVVLRRELQTIEAQVMQNAGRHDWMAPTRAVTVPGLPTDPRREAFNVADLAVMSPLTRPSAPPPAAPSR